MKKFLTWCALVVGMVALSGCGGCPNGINTTDPSCPAYQPYGQGYPYGQYGQNPYRTYPQSPYAPVGQFPQQPYMQQPYQPMPMPMPYPPMQSPYQQPYQQPYQPRY